MQETQETWVWPLGLEDSLKEGIPPYQYSCLENPMDRGVWQTTVHGVANNPMKWLKWLGHNWSDLHTGTEDAWLVLQPCVFGYVGNPHHPLALELVLQPFNWNFYSTLRIDSFQLKRNRKSILLKRKCPEKVQFRQWLNHTTDVIFHFLDSFLSFKTNNWLLEK